MGFFSSSAPSPPAPKISTDGTPIAPSRSDRSRCWEARDAYFKCLDRSEIIDSIKDKDAAEKACGPESKAFEGSCASSWIQYFKKQRVVEHKKNQVLQRLKEEDAVEFPPNSFPDVPKGRR